MTAINQISESNIHILKLGGLLDDYQRFATKSAIYPGQGTPLGLAYVALKLNGEAGEFAEHVGKAMRDDSLMHDTYCGYCHASGKDPLDDGRDCPRCNGTAESDSKELTPQRRLHLIKEVGDVLWYLSAACNELGIKLSEAAVTNLEKLRDRQLRNTQRGSGDDR